jgi:hypothetical protein
VALWRLPRPDFHRLVNTDFQDTPLALRPGDSLTILVDGFVNRLQDYQFPSFLLFKLRGLDSYPGGTFPTVHASLRWTHTYRDSSRHEPGLLPVWRRSAQDRNFPQAGFSIP